MNRTKDEWEKMRPLDVLCGSDASVLTCLQHAKEDIKTLWLEVELLHAGLVIAKRHIMVQCKE